MIRRPVAYDISRAPLNEAINSWCAGRLFKRLE